jgi:hypothetical protein
MTAPATTDHRTAQLVSMTGFHDDQSNDDNHATAGTCREPPPAVRAADQTATSREIPSYSWNDGNDRGIHGLASSPTTDTI